MRQEADPARIDAHAHIAPDVTPNQVAALGNTLVLAMTRSLDEARQVVRRDDINILWGVGTHPAVAKARAGYRSEAFRVALEYFVVVGEVGLDRRGPLREQERILRSILDECDGAPVLISLHSTGRTSELLTLLENSPHPGAILHWFTGDTTDLQRAVDLGVHFSVNAAMTAEMVSAIPRHLLLSETDFPSSRRRTGARLPGDTTKAEDLIRHSHPGVEPRDLIRKNMRNLLDSTGATTRLSPPQRALI